MGESQSKRRKRGMNPSSDYPFTSIHHPLILCFFLVFSSFTIHTDGHQACTSLDTNYVSTILIKDSNGEIFRAQQISSLSRMNDKEEEDSRQTVQRKRRLSKKERKALKKQKVEEKQQVVDDEEPKIDYMKSYEPIPVPTHPSNDITKSKGIADNNDDLEGGGGGKTLGKWFPNAILCKCSINYTNTGRLLTNGPVQGIDKDKTKNPKSSLVLFYQYTEKQKKWSPHLVKLLMTYLSTIAKKRNLGGRIRVATEGVNATLSAVDMPTKDGISASETLRHVAQDLKNFDPVFQETDFKFIDDLTPDRHFKELRVIPVEELVFYGIREKDAACEEGGVHLDAKDYHEMLKKENAVVIDVRNHYEAVIGRFDGQEKDNGDPKEGKQDKDKKSGAEYIDPKMRKSTDFTQWLGKDSTKEKLKDKTVLMFCTGGIRCERASAYLKKEMGSEVEGVYQLQGGIERYLKAFPDGGFWRGKVSLICIYTRIIIPVFSLKMCIGTYLPPFWYAWLELCF